MLVSSTRVEQTQTLHRICDRRGKLHLLLRTASRSLDVPYGDTFEVLDAVLVTPCSNAGCKVRVAGRVKFQSRGLLSQRIETLTITGITPAVRQWFSQVRKHAVALSRDDIGDQAAPAAGPKQADPEDQLADTVAALVDAASDHWWHSIVTSHPREAVTVHQLAERAGQAEAAVGMLRLAVVLLLAAVVGVSLLMVLQDEATGEARPITEERCWQQCGKHLLSRAADRIDTLWTMKDA
jgi:hypothetical protein